MFKDYEMIHMASGLTILTVYSLGVVNFDTYSSHTSDNEGGYGQWDRRTGI